MQGRIQHHRVNPKACHRHTLADGHLGKDLLPPPPQCSQTLKCRPVLVAAARQHAHTRHRRRTADAPAGGHTDKSAAELRRPRTQRGLRVQHPHRIRARATRIDPHAREPDSPAGVDDDLHPGPPSDGNTNGANNVSSSTTEQPTSSPARNSQLHESRTGKQHHSVDDVIGQPRQIPTDNEPVSTTPPESGRSTTAPSNG